MATPPAARGVLTRYLERAPGPIFAIFAMAAAFSTYFCMYAFRKPFGAGTYEGFMFWGTGLDLKTALVTSQILGYALSKFIGIKLISEVTRARRLLFLVALIGVAEAALLLFAVVPPQWKVVALFLNGLPLGMVWGLVVWYLEGRRSSELLLAGLSCSFIVASGAVKDIGRWLMREGVSEFWMPAATGALFLLPFVVAAWLLDQVPEPTAADEEERSHRTPMDGNARWDFVRHFAPGMVMLLVAYFVLTAYRDFRDNFGMEIFNALGYGDQPAIFTQTEVWVALGVMVCLALLSLIRDNKKGLLGAYAIMTSGLLLLGVSTLLFDAGRLPGDLWMVLVGLGAYLAYVPFGSVLFDRLIASTRVVGTAVFAIYLADAVGYTGAITVMWAKDLLAADISRLEFFRQLTYFMALLGTALMLGSCWYFLAWHHHGPSDEAAPAGELSVDTPPEPEYNPL